MSRKIIRWTLGDVHEDGLECLRVSIRFAKRIYPECERFVLHNTISHGRLRGIDANLVEQRHNEEVEYQPWREMWKLYPPRLDTGSHELVLDNDVIIWRRVPQLDEFWSGDHSVLLAGKARKYGKYDGLVPAGYVINSGFYGMPPGFDFASGIRDAVKRDVSRKWEMWCDDQGIVACCLTKENHVVVGPNTILNYFPEDRFELSYGLCGVHFQGMNRGLRGNWRKLLSKFIALS